MTKEINDIIVAFKEAQKYGRQTALVTVVHVEGSSYRRPGARMLVEDNGRLTGAISGGCLEGDALRKALLVMNQKQNQLVTYNTLHDEDMQFGVQLGCNGVVDILFEPIDSTQPGNPIVLLENCLQHRKNAVLITLFSLENKNGIQPGTCLFFDGERTDTNLFDKHLQTALSNDAAAALSDKTSITKTYKDGELIAFIELVEPTVSLTVVGAGNDAIPLVEMANILGWQTTVIDGRSTHLNQQRFPKANRLLLGKPAEASKQVLIDDRTVFVLMTHNYNYDLEMLGILLKSKCRYIGTLGPKKRLERMLAELEEKGQHISNEQRAMIYGPTGLDIGAEAPEEIALAVLAEIKAVLMKRQGTSLRDRLDAIHSRSKMSIDAAQTTE